MRLWHIRGHYADGDELYENWVLAPASWTADAVRLALIGRALAEDAWVTAEMLDEAACDPVPSLIQDGRVYAAVAPADAVCHLSDTDLAEGLTAIS